MMNFLISILTLIIGMIGLIVLMGAVYGVIILSTYLYNRFVKPSIQKILTNVWLIFVSILMTILILISCYAMGLQILNLF